MKKQSAKKKKNAKTPKAKVIARLLGAAATLVALKMVGLSFARPKILGRTLGVVVFGLAVHVPIMFAFDPGTRWFVVVVAAVTFVAFLLAGTKRVQDDLLRFGPEARLASL